jgi:hypothetical protein
MTTRKELQEWLNQFPEDTEIEVITTHEGYGGWESYTSVYENSLDLTEPVDPEFGTFGKTFEIERDYKTKVVTRIVFGVKG